MNRFIYKSAKELAELIRNMQATSTEIVKEHTGFTNVCILEDLDELEISKGKIIALPFMGEHGDLDVGTKLGYLIDLGGYKILCLVDSQNLEFKMYEHVHKIYGDIDVLFLGMECNGAPVSWIYCPYLPEKLQRDKDLSGSIIGSDYACAIDNYSCGLNLTKKYTIRKYKSYLLKMQRFMLF